GWGGSREQKDGKPRRRDLSHGERPHSAPSPPRRASSRRGPARPERCRLPDQPIARTQPSMTSSHPLPRRSQWFARLSATLDRRSAPTLALMLLGAVLARGRRTVTSWIRAAKLGERFQSCYVAVAAAGKRSDRIAWRLFTEVVRPLLKGAERMTIALGDTPTK